MMGVMIARSSRGESVGNHPWRFGALVAVASVFAASCSGSGPIAQTRPPATTTTTRAPTTTAVYQTLPPRVAVGPTGQIRVNTGPVIGKYSPLSSPVGGTVIIGGRRLGSVTKVTFNGIPATVSLERPTKLKVVVPPGATTGPLTVTTPFGSDTIPGFVVT